jgi:hypothetical protein
LLRVVLGDTERHEYLWEKKVAKSSGEGGEASAVACFGSLFATNLFNSVAGVVAVV